MKNMILVLIIFSALAAGHKISIFAAVEGNRVYTQSYASDGSKVKGGIIEVHDGTGNLLLTGKTDSLGEFFFTAPKKDDLKIVVSGGMGHRAETTISAEDLPDIKSAPVKKETKKGEVKETRGAPGYEAAGIDTAVLKRMIDDALSSHLRPFVKMAAEQGKDRISFTEVIGGIGYILGIMGIVMFFLSRRK